MPYFRGPAVVYIGTWADRPAVSSLPEDARIRITDIGNQGRVEFAVVSGAYRLTAATVLYLSETQQVGLAQAAEQALFTTPSIQHSVLKTLRYYSVSFLITKSAAVNTVTNASMREGMAGTLSDTAVYSGNSFLNVAVFRAASAGTLRKYNAATERTQNFHSGQQTALEIINNTSAVWPQATSAVLTDALVFVTMAVTMSAAPTDVPALERIMIVGY